jgi:hypothetical protein
MFCLLSRGRGVSWKSGFVIVIVGQMLKSVLQITDVDSAVLDLTPPVVDVHSAVLTSGPDTKKICA